MESDESLPTRKTANGLRSARSIATSWQMSSNTTFNVDEPRWDQSTFSGRLKHFFNITDPRTAFVPASRLHDAKRLLEVYREGRMLINASNSVDEVYYAQKLYMSAFHPDTGELQNVFGRMSFQVPGGMVLIGAMTTFYRSTPAVVFWQWANQSFNALVNFTNRNAKSSVTPAQMLFAYITATSSALVAAIGLKNYLSSRAGSLAQRFVPFVAVAAANCVNIPLMRQTELKDGILCNDERGVPACKSRLAAVKAISLVVISRIVIVVPSMLLLPVVMERLIEQRAWFRRHRSLLNAPTQMLFAGATLLVMVPVGCALFPQKNSVSIGALRRFDRRAYEELEAKRPGMNETERVYFNKGL